MAGDAGDPPATDPSLPMRYVTDIPYLGGITSELAPEWLDLVALVAGVTPPDRSRGFSWCELGCGRGITAVVLAATHPAGRFVGVDLMQEHIDAARRAASNAGAENVDFHALDFAAAAELELPKFDYIVAHGVYSWIDAGALADFHRFIDRHLAPGGLVYVSYNAMPGWAADAPVQHLIRSLAAAEPGPSDARVLAAATAVQSFLGAGAAALQASSVARGWRDGHARRPAAYLAHEFLAPAWHACYVTEVRAAMLAIGLQPVGSATLQENFDSMVLGQSARAALGPVSDPDLRELVRDYFLAQRFRRDVFGRAPTRLSDAERRQRLLETPIALLRPPALVGYSYRTEAGEVGFDNVVARAMVAALAHGPKAVGQCGDAEPRDLIANAIALCCAGMATPALRRPAQVQPLNAALLHEDSELPTALRVLPWGPALRFSRIFLQAWAENRPVDPEAAPWAELLAVSECADRAQPS